jgi:hypothetical protein
MAERAAELIEKTPSPDRAIEKLVAVDSGPDRVVYAGPVFSHWEFEAPGAGRKSDSEWREDIREGKLPPRPAWTKGYLVPGVCTWCRRDDRRGGGGRGSGRRRPPRRLQCRFGLARRTEGAGLRRPPRPRRFPCTPFLVPTHVPWWPQGRPTSLSP